MTINGLSLYLPTGNPSPETQRLFNEANKKSFTLTIESWRTQRKQLSTSKEVQLEIIFSSKINVVLFLVAAHQKTQRKNSGEVSQTTDLTARFSTTLLLKKTLQKLVELDTWKILILFITLRKLI